MSHQTHYCQTSFMILVVCLTYGCDDNIPNPSTIAQQHVDEVVPAPKDVLEKFYVSLSQSDAITAIACTTGDPLTQEFVESQVRLNEAFALFGKNAVESFSEAGQSLQMPSPSLVPLKRLAEVPVIVAGENATWPSNPSAPMRLVLKDGQWKLDLGKSFPSADLVRTSIQSFDAIAGYVTDIANEMAAGKYASVDAVRQELKLRGQAAKQ